MIKQLLKDLYSLFTLNYTYQNIFEFNNFITESDGEDYENILENRINSYEYKYECETDSYIYKHPDNGICLLDI